MSFSLLETKSLVKKYNPYDIVLQQVEVTFHSAQFTVILGPSGSGKSTLLNVVSGLLKPTSGLVYYKGIELKKLSDNKLAEWKKNNIGLVFQHYYLLSNLTVYENILTGVTDKEQRKEILPLAKRLEIDELLDKFPSELSGGQQQRTAIARAVIKKPDILFCDEATGALDESNSKKVVALLQNLKEDYGMCVIFVTHNQDIAAAADRIIYMKDGKIMEDKLNISPVKVSNMQWGMG